MITNKNKNVPKNSTRYLFNITENELTMYNEYSYYIFFNNCIFICLFRFS